MFGLKAENILIVKTDGLAAFVAAEPVFEAIRNAAPKAKISLLTAPSLQRLARAAPYFDQVAALPNMHDAEARRVFIRQLKSARFARVFDLSGDETSKKIQGAMGPFGPKWHCVQAAPKNRRRGKSEAPAPDCARLLADAGVAPVDRLPNFEWALSARKDSANMQPSWFGIAGAFGLLLPSMDPARRWPASAYAQLARRLAQARIMPVLAGGKELHGFGDEIAHEAPEIVDLTGKCDHLQLTALAREAAFFVSDAAEEVCLVASVGCSGVIIRTSPEAPGQLAGRHIVTLTAKGGLGDADPDFVWRTLDNMGLIPLDRPAHRAASR